MTVSLQHETFQFLPPWARVVKRGENLENELKKELTDTHPLFSLGVRAVAQRTDRDDVLFEVNAPDFKFAVVHLTWTGEPEKDPQWPETHFIKLLTNGSNSE